MLILNGKYHVQPNKRLTILTENKVLPREIFESDIAAMRTGCELNGRCEVQVMTQHGVMFGTLVEKKPIQMRLWQFEGHLSFPAKA